MALWFEPASLKKKIPVKGSDLPSFDQPSDESPCDDADRRRRRNS
jgi:hypothetical protein